MRRGRIAGSLLLASALLLAAGGLEALGPIFGKLFIDEYLLPRRFESVADRAVGRRHRGQRLAWPVRCATSSWFDWRGLRCARCAGLRESVYNHVLRLPMAFFDRAITGQLVSRITNDTEQIRQLYVQVLFEMLQGVTVLIGAVVAMAWLDWRLMLIVLTLVPATVLIVIGYQRLSAHAVMRSRELRSDINAQMGESIAGMSVLQATGAARRFAARFANTNREHYRGAARRGTRECVAAAARARHDEHLADCRDHRGVRHAVVRRARNRTAVRVHHLRCARRRAADLDHDAVLAAAAGAGRGVARQHAARRGRSRSRVTHERRVSRGHVQLIDVSFGYDPQQPVLHDVSIDVPAGSFVGIVGHTGSGKSTLLSLLLRFYAPQAGRMEIDGIPLATIGDEHFRADVGLVPQEPFLLAASARENIDMGRNLPSAQIEAAARAANAHDFISALEQGYDTPLGEGGARLSSGQKQLIAVARALAGRAARAVP